MTLITKDTDDKKEAGPHYKKESINVESGMLGLCSKMSRSIMSSWIRQKESAAEKGLGKQCFIHILSNWRAAL